MKTINECISATPCNTIGAGDINPIVSEPLPKKKFKSLKVYLQQKNIGILKPTKPKQTYEEMVLDLCCVCNDIIATKDIDILGEKYKVTLKKSKLILKNILELLQRLRWYRTDFNETDIMHFTKLNPPSQYAKFENFLKNENILFCKVLLEKYKNILVNNDLIDDNGKIIKERLNTFNKHQVKNYENMYRYLSERSKI